MQISFDTFVALGQKMFEKKTGNGGGRVAYDVSLDKSNENRFSNIGSFALTLWATCKWEYGP